ncbi:MAG: EAL domain-containing protein, partial [Lachnospiraceae bacterium]
ALFLEEFVKRGVYYLGSNVFVLMLENDSYKEVTEIMQKIDRRFEEKWEGTGSSIYITVRMMKLMFPKEVKDLQTFYTYVDYMKELDNSKKWILNATDVSLKDNNRRIVVETAVKDAIRNDGFQVFYQPIYSVDERKIQSAEALVRLSDPVIGPISPAEFIPIAERNGTILKIGIIVFEKVCKFISENNLRDKGIEYVEINLSVVQCMQENMGDELLDIMKKYHLESSRINLEVTETAAISSPKMLVKNMHHLFDHGVRFSLDDFGTGYSNISSLANLPLDMIKFDKVMVDSLVKADRGKMLLISSIAMVKRMNLKIVAEGVEERAQAETLIQMGVDYIQGYYFERPIPGKEFLAFVEQFQIENYLS